METTLHGHDGCLIRPSSWNGSDFTQFGSICDTAIHGKLPIDLILVTIVKVKSLHASVSESGHVVLGSYMVSSSF